MNIGLPGAGIGGLYYLTCAAIMPIKELLLTIRNPEHKFRTRLVATQMGIATGIVAGFVLIYQLVSPFIGFSFSVTVPEHSNIALFYSLLPLAVSYGLLMVLLLLVELCAFITKQNMLAKRKAEA